MDRSRRHGFTLLELTASLALFVILLGALSRVVVETSRFLADSDLDYTVASEVNRAFLKLSQELVRSGWSENESGVSYPQVAAGGSELRFRLPVDLDGNGTPFDADGGLEWSATVFSVRLDAAERALWIHDENGPAVLLGRLIESVSFATYKEDASLALREVRIEIDGSKVDAGGREARHAVSASISLRN